MKIVSDIPMEFIEHSLEQGIEFAKKQRTSFEGDCVRMYFAGRTLFIDTKQGDSITLSHASESYGWFSDGMFRALMSIKACKLMEELMVMCKIQHEQKWVS